MDKRDILIAQIGTDLKEYKEYDENLENDIYSNGKRSDELLRIARKIEKAESVEDNEDRDEDYPVEEKECPECGGRDILHVNNCAQVN